MNCSYCKKDMAPGFGSQLVLKDGKIVRFCSNKCRKNYKIGRDPKNLKWITKEKRVKGD